MSRPWRHEQLAWRQHMRGLSPDEREELDTYERKERDMTFATSQFDLTNEQKKALAAMGFDWSKFLAYVVKNLPALWAILKELMQQRAAPARAKAAAAAPGCCDHLTRCMNMVTLTGEAFVEANLHFEECCAEHEG